MKKHLKFTLPSKRTNSFFLTIGFLILLFSPIFIYAQESKNVKLLGNWNRTGLEMIDNQRFNDIWAWTDELGNEYAIMGGLDSIYFFDISNPSKIVLCDVVAGKDKRCIHRDFKTYQHYAYAVADEGNSSLQIFDLSYLPDSVHKVYDNDTFSIRTHNIFIDQDRLYLASNRNKLTYYPMSVLSLKNPKNPKFLTYLESPWVNDKPLFMETHDVFVRNDTAYCSNGDGGFFIYLYSDSNTVTVNGNKITEYSPNLKLMQGGVLTKYPSAGYNHSSWISANGKLLVFADETKGSPLKLYDLSNPNQMKLLSTFGSNHQLGSMPHNPMIKGDYVYISYYEEGFQVFSLKNTAEPQQIAFYDTYPEKNNQSSTYEGCWGVYPFLPSGNIIASDQKNGLFVFEVDLSSSKEDTQLLKTDWSVYPNPFVDYCIVSLPEAEGTLEWLTIGGKKLGFTQFSKESGEYRINQTDLDGFSGILLLRITTNEAFKTRMIIKL